MVTIIRVIWGNDIFKNEGFLRELKKGHEGALKHTKYPTVFCIYGNNNKEELLKLYPDASILMISELPLPFCPHYNHWYHKIYALKRALEIYKDILYLDFDTYFVNDFTDYDLDKINKQDLYIPYNYRVRRQAILYKGRETNKFRNKGPVNCFIKIKDVNIINDWLSIYNEFENVNDERIVDIWMERKYGVDDIKLYQKHHEPTIFQTKSQDLKDLSEIVFIHYLKKYYKLLKKYKNNRVIVSRELILLDIHNHNINDYIPDNKNYLKYIIDNYDKLPNEVTFVPTSYNLDKLTEIVKETKKDIVTTKLYNKIPKYVIYDNIPLCKLNFKRLYKEIFGTNIGNISYFLSNMFKVKKKLILKYPKCVYQRLFDMIPNQDKSEEDYFMSILWYTLFGN